MADDKWAIRMNPGDSYPFTKAGILTLNQISLTADAVEGKTTLKVQAKGHVFFLCSLITNAHEVQELSHSLIAEDKATLILTGKNSVDIFGTYEEDDRYMEGEEEEEQDEEMETITGQPMYANYLSDLLGPDLPDDDDEDYEDMSEDQDEFGTLAFRDPADNSLLGGFEFRHFNLAPQIPGFEPLNLREQEDDMEDTLLNDSIAKGLVNALMNSGDDFQIKQGKEMLKKLKRQQKQRKQKK